MEGSQLSNWNVWIALPTAVWHICIITLQIEEFRFTYQKGFSGCTSTNNYCKDRLTGVWKARWNWWGCFMGGIPRLVKMPWIMWRNNVPFLDLLERTYAFNGIRVPHSKRNLPRYKLLHTLKRQPCILMILFGIKNLISYTHINTHWCQATPPYHCVNSHLPMK